MNFKKEIKKYYDSERKVYDSLNLNEINNAMNAIYSAYLDNKTVYICGNGGSAATASHFANDFNKGLGFYIKKKFNFCCLNDNVATLLAIANDIGYEEIFRFQLIDKIKKGDLLIGISGSGNSENVLNAAKYAKERGAKIIGITGFNGGKLMKISDYNMHVNINDMQITEDVHMSFDHMIMKIFMNILKIKII